MSSPQRYIRLLSVADDLPSAARGNTSLESAVSLTKSIRLDIQALGVRLANAANEGELLKRKSARAKTHEQNQIELDHIVADVRKLLASIEDAVPLINLAITTSGVKLTTNLPATVSPSRLLQASTFLSAADQCYATAPSHAVQAGPTYTLSLYMLFAGHTNRQRDDLAVRETTWKEVIHKARVKLLRVPLDSLYRVPGDSSSASISPPNQVPAESRASEFGYQLLLVEDLDDGRVHDDDTAKGAFEDIPSAGIRDVIPIHQISKIFYADTAKILDIGGEGEINNPVLLLRRDVHAVPPRRMLDGNDFDQSVPSVDDDESEINAQLHQEALGPNMTHGSEIMPHTKNGLPPDLDPEWIALEVYREDVDSDDEESDLPTDPPSRPSPTPSISDIDQRLTALDLSNPNITSTITVPPLLASTTGPVRTSLSALEMLIRLTALQQFKQSSHLTIEDELLNFFLEDSANTGAGDAERRRELRSEARRRVGFDPFDESPIKRRGEEYLAHPRATPPGERFADDRYFDGTPRSATRSGSLDDRVGSDGARDSTGRKQGSGSSMHSGQRPELASRGGASRLREEWTDVSSEAMSSPTPATGLQRPLPEGLGISPAIASAVRDLRPAASRRRSARNKSPLEPRDEALA